MHWSKEEEEEVRQALLRFYQALDDLLLNRGVGGIRDTWHHEDFVTTVHPFGHWAKGWNEVLATFEEVGAVFSYYRGHLNRQDGIGTIHDPHIAVLGDVAYAAGVYKSVMYSDGKPVPLSVNCTNVLQRQGGLWKMVHHHPDEAPADYRAFLASLVEKR